MDESQFTFTHLSLGSLTGVIRSPSVVQFRNLPYAQIPARFRQSRLINALSTDQRNCTANGYASPQIPQTAAAFGGPLLGEPVREYDEFSCLNLIINVPRQALERAQSDRKSSLLPVMVYVHGGAFSEGVHLGAVQGKLPTSRSCIAY